jgi:hypothetical protein
MPILTGVMGNGTSFVGTIYADADIRIDTDGKSVEDIATVIPCRLKGF